MSVSRRAVARGLAACLVAGFACVYPTERGAEFRVVMDPIPDLLRGELYQLHAQVVDAAGTALPTADVSFSSGDPLVATVTPEGEILGVGVGTTEISATAVEFAGAEQAVAPARIHDLIEVDSVRPRLVRFGDTVSIYGAGLNPVPFLLVSFGGAEVPIKSYEPVIPELPNRFGRLTVWVRPPTPLIAQALLLGVEGLATGPDTMLVGQNDIYEPNDTIPWDFGDLDRQIRNPALAFETVPRDDSARADWYRFTQVAAQDRTIIIRSDQVGPESYSVFFTDELIWNSASQEFAIGPQAWTIGPSLYACQGVPFGPPQHLADSVVVALKDFPGGRYDLIAGYTRRGAYELAILRQYRSALPPDAFEENDYCDAAPQLPLDQVLNLTIDNPHDIDWFRFTVLTDGRNVAFDVSAAEEGADLDIYILRDDLPTTLTLMGLTTIGGETDAVVVPLDAADYFAVVVDYAGVPTEYTLSTVVAGPALDMSQVVRPAMPRADLRSPVPVLIKANR
jgi:hypothetical protein